MKATARIRSYLALAGSSLLAISYSHATTYTWANSNVTGLTPPSSLNWFNATQGAWTGGTPVSSNLNTIQFFQDTTTALPNTGAAGNTQASIIDNGGSAFQLGTLTLSGLASSTTGANLTMNISGDALNFSAATGTINLDARNATRTITYNLNSNIQLGTASSAGALTITGNGTSAFNIGGIISELKAGGGSLIKSGSSTVSLINTNTYTGTTTLNGGTLVLSGAAGSIASSTGITFNGGNLTLTNADNDTEDDLNRIKDNAAIVSNGGTITYTTTTASSARNFIETIGSVALTTGQLNLVNTLDKSSGSQTLALSGLSRAGTSAITFSNAGGLNTTTNRIRVNGITSDTAANKIIGAWATVGTAANGQTDYAVYDSDGIHGYVVARNIAASDQSSWTTAANVYTANAGASTGGSTGLSGTRTIAALRSISGANAITTVDNAGNTFSLASNTFANGDAFILGGTAPTGLTTGNTYFVVNKSGDTFQLENTPGSGFIDFSTNGTSVTAAGAITLSTGKNLETYGLLNGVSTTLNVVRTGTGVLTTPSGGGDLYLTTGSGGITISAPITDNGAVAVVKSGLGTLTLSGANTYTGATTINAGTLTTSGTGSLGSGNYAGNIFIASNAVLNFGNPAQTLGGNIDIANNGTLNFSGISNTTAVAYTVNGAISGSGALNFNTLMNNAGGTLTLNGNNTYTGKTSFGPGNIISTLTLSVSSFDYITSGSYANHGLGSSLGAPTTVANGTILIGAVGNGSASASATLIYTGPGETTDRVLSFAFGQNSGQRRIDASGTGLLKFTSPFTLTSGPTATPAITLQGSGLGEVAGGIADLYLGLPVTKTGTGTWTLSGANTYTGATTISGGTLNLGSAENANVSGPLGKQLATAAGTILMTGSGTLRYSAANQFDYSGRFSIAGAQTWVIDTNNQAVTFGTILQGASTLTKTGLGTLTLSANNSYTGITTVNGGTLLLDKTGTGALAATSALTLGGGTFQVKGASSGATTQTLGSLVLTANTGSKIVLDPNNSGAGSTILTVGNAWTRNAGSSLLIDYSSSNTGTRQVVTAGATTSYVLSNGIYGGILVKDSGGTGFATRSASAGTQPITRFDDTTGTTLVNNSNVAATNFTTLNTVYTSGTLNWNNVITARSVNSLTIDTTNNGGTINMGASTNVLTLTGLGILFKGTNDAILTGGKVGASASEVIVHQTSSTNTLTINSEISAAAGSLTKDGVGTLIVGGTNVFTGAVRVNDGALRLANAAATGTSAGGIFVNNGAALELSGGLNFVADALTITGDGISSGGALRNVSGANLYQGAITIGNGGARINNADTINALTVRGITTAANANVTFGGAGNITHDTTAISGTGNLIKDGAGTLTTSVANTYNGATTVSGGTLTVASGGNINTTSGLTVSAGAKLAYNSSTALTVAPTLNGAGLASRAVLGGTGTINVAVTLDNVGDTLSPGNSPGIEPFAVGQSWAAFSYDWEVNDFSDVTGLTAGSDFDQIGITGGLTLTGAAVNSYYLNVLSLTAGNVTGLAENFTEINRSWNILTTTTGITGFDASYWNINSTGFTNVETGTWSLAQSGNNLVLSYTVVPEPRAALLGGLGLLMLLRRRRK